MNLTTICLLVVLFVALITPIRNLIQLMIEFVKKTARKWHHRRHQAKISAILYEVTHMIPTNVYSVSEYVGVAREIASPAPRPTKGLRYTGDTLSFILCDKSSSPASFVLKKKKEHEKDEQSNDYSFLVWEKDGKAFFYDRKEGTVLLSFENSKRLMSLLDTARKYANQCLKFRERKEALAKLKLSKRIEPEVA